MSRFDEDRAESQVNEASLEQEFNIDNTEARQFEIQQIREMRMALVEAAEQDDPDTILLQNIDRANNLLDIAQRGIENGGETQARMFEVCAQLINAITSASASIQSTTFGNQKHEYNMRQLELKEKEILVKAAMANDKAGQRAMSGTGTTDGKVVVMDRESLLKMMEEKEVQVESAGMEEVQEETESE